MKKRLLEGIEEAKREMENGNYEGAIGDLKFKFEDEYGYVFEDFIDIEFIKDYFYNGNIYETYEALSSIDDIYAEIFVIDREQIFNVTKASVEIVIADLEDILADLED